MSADPVLKVYRVVLRGELGDQFAFLFDGMRLERDSGLTTLTGAVVDQVRLIGLIERAQELGVDLVSVEQVVGKVASE